MTALAMLLRENCLPPFHCCCWQDAFSSSACPAARPTSSGAGSDPSLPLPADLHLPRDLRRRPRNIACGGRSARLDALPPGQMEKAIELTPFTVDGHRGINLHIGESVLFNILEGDLDPDEKISLDELASSRREP
jgi:hypothetical protein